MRSDEAAGKGKRRGGGRRFGRERRKTSFGSAALRLEKRRRRDCQGLPSLKLHENGDKAERRSRKVKKVEKKEEKGKRGSSQRESRTN